MAIVIDYDRLATDYAQYRRVHPEVLRRITSGMRHTDKVLEVGCGTGNYILAIWESIGCPCWGTDPSTEMLAQAAGRPGQVQLSCGKAETLDFPAGHFDLVFSVDVIHHVDDRDQFFREAVRVLRPGGKVCTVTDSEWVIRHREPLAVYFPETVAVDLARYPRMQDLRTGMQGAGFVEIVETMVEFACKLQDIAPFRAKAFSCLRLISENEFQRGMGRMAQDASNGAIPSVSRYTLVWGAKPSRAH
ncbi:MAG: class I SAM-dependent methyltransferase [Thermoguttaceae bacterium]